MIDVGETNTPEVAYYESRGGDTTMDIPPDIAAHCAQRARKDNVRLAKLLCTQLRTIPCAGAPESDIQFLLRLLAAERAKNPNTNE